MPRCLLGGRAALLLALLLLHLVTAVNIIFDEVAWTKENTYQVDWDDLDMNPSDGFAPQLRELLASSKYNSLDGPTPRRDIVALPT